MLNLPFLPNYYDYMYLIALGKMSRDAFDAMISRLEKMLAQPRRF
jgi:hypothetical protein